MSAGPTEIRLHGVREGRLDGVDLRLPLRRLVCLSGPMGYGVEALAHRVLLGESRRRYLLSMSPFERESLGGVGAAAAVDDIAGLPPAQGLPGPTGPEHCVATRLQLVGDLVRVVQAGAVVMCDDCGGECAVYLEDDVGNELQERFSSQTCLVVAPMQLQAVATAAAVVDELGRAGFRRVRLAGEVRRLEQVDPKDLGAATLQVVVDRLSAGRRDRTRVGEAVRNAWAIAGGVALLIGEEDGFELWAGQRRTCTRCGRWQEEPDWESLVRGTRASGDSPTEVRWQGQRLEDLTVGLRLEDLAVFDVAHGPLMASASRLRRAGEVGAEHGIAHLPLWRPVGELAHGEQLLLSIAAGLIGGLSGVLYVVVAPLSGLHPDTRARVAGGLRRLLASGSSVVAVDGAESAREWADEVLEIGSPQALSQPAKVDAGSAVPIVHEDVIGVVVEAAPGASCGPVPPGPALAVPLGGLAVLSGPTGAGKTALLGLVRAALARPARRGPRAVRAPGIKRCVDISVEIGAAAGERTVLLEWLGAMRPLARLLAASPTAQEQKLSAEAFLLERAGGRCSACEGRGVIRHRLDVVDDLLLTCPRCEGRRFGDAALQATARGLTVAEVLAMTVREGEAHYGRERTVHAPLAEALRCGLGARALGDPVDDLERAERLLARLARHAVQARSGDLFLVDRPLAGCRESEASCLARALRRLCTRGATVIAAEAGGGLASVTDVEIQLPARAWAGGPEAAVGIPS